MNISARWTCLVVALAFMCAATVEIKGKCLIRHKKSATKTAEPATPMALIPAGSFKMGSDGWRKNPPDEFPRHTVWLDAFYMDKYEVTAAQYLCFAKASGKKTPPTLTGRFHPITGVSWHDAVAYCKWTGKRLPTEAEWEKAALADRPHRLNHPSTAEEQLRHQQAKEEATRPVGEAPPNQYGLYDMDGNVWEWCADWYDENYYAHSPPINPKGPETGNSRVLRGGASHYGLGVHVVRPAARMWASPDEPNDYGFRCAKDSDTFKKNNEKN